MPTSRSRSARRQIHTTLAQYQHQVIIKHCPACRRPCCMLTDVVLEFDWRDLCSFYGFDDRQKTFDRGLRNGSGPAYIRKQAGLYYVHGSPCPAYDEHAHQCRYYQSPLKPQNCSDFPVYLDGRSIVADTRCEALDLNNLLQALKAAAPTMDFTTQPHPDFAVLNYIEFRPNKRSQV